MTWQWLAVHSICREPEVAQHRRGDVDQRRAAVMDARGKSAAGDEQERALFVSAEPAMLAKARRVLRFERVAHDVAVAQHAVRIGALVGFECQRDPQGRARRQAGGGELGADKGAADPLLGLQKPRDLRDKSARRLGEIEQCGGTVRCDDDVG